MVKIITHGGQAHRDEFVAIAMILALHRSIVEIVRAPYAKFTFDMQGEADYVVDIGLEYDPAKRRYDHHQDKVAFGDSRSAFARVAEDLIGWDAERAKDVFPWYQLSSDMDCHGPGKVAASLGLSVAGLFSCLSPIEAQLLVTFERDPTSLIPLMREMGDGWLAYYAEYAAAEVAHVAAAEVVMLPCYQQDELSFSVAVLDLTRLDVSQQHNAVSLRLARQHRAVVVVSRDPTGAGLSLFRVDDAHCVDFSPLEGAEGVLFAHANGFIAKTKTVDFDWQTLLKVMMAARFLAAAKASNMSNGGLAIDTSNAELAS